MAMFPKKFLTTIAISSVLALSSCMGHFYFCILSFILATKLYFEIVNIRKKQDQEIKVGPSIFIFELMIYLTACYIFIPWLVFPRFLIETSLSNKDHWVYDAFYNYNPLFAFFMSVACFLFFVLHLKKGSYRYQVRIFVLSLVGAVFGFAGSLLACKNAYKGLFWVILPHSAMMINDSAAYLVGLTTFGKTRLVKISNHRTLEGFLIGMISSSLWCYFAMQVMAKNQALICPQNNLELIPFKELSCEPPKAFSDRVFQLPYGLGSIYTSPAALSCFFIAFCSSVIAPFSGYVMISVKRAYRIENQDENTIGFVDKLDSHGMISYFMNFYLESVLFKNRTRFQQLLELVSRLNQLEQQKLVNDILVN